MTLEVSTSWPLQPDDIVRGVQTDTGIRAAVAFLDDKRLSEVSSHYIRDLDIVHGVFDRIKRNRGNYVETTYGEIKTTWANYRREHPKRKKKFRAPFDATGPFNDVDED